MELNGGEFETEIDSNGYFAISICQESDCSPDGGYTFEDVTNTFCIDRHNAKYLMAELQHYISNSC